MAAGPADHGGVGAAVAVPEAVCPQNALPFGLTQQGHEAVGGAALPGSHLLIVDQDVGVVEAGRAVPRVEQVETGAAGRRGVVGVRRRLGQQQRAVAARILPGGGRAVPRKGGRHRSVAVRDPLVEEFRGRGGPGAGGAFRAVGGAGAGRREQPGGAAGRVGDAQPQRAGRGRGPGQFRPAVGPGRPAQGRGGRGDGAQHDRGRGEGGGDGQGCRARRRRELSTGWNPVSRPGIRGRPAAGRRRRRGHGRRVR